LEITGDIVSYTASLISQGRSRFYSLEMPSDVLAETCTVDTQEADPVRGFQRRLDPKRAQDIADYIDRGFGTIPSAIVLSAQPEAHLEYNRPKENTEIQKGARAARMRQDLRRLFGGQRGHYQSDVG
jgi:DGQHR domain-containing protein